MMRPVKSDQIREHNRAAWNDRVRLGKWFIDTATDEDFRHALQVIDPRGWLGGDVNNKRILCLAAGGGRHGVLLASVGAQVTVADLSPAMLALDRKIAQERGLSIHLVETSMDDLSMLSPASFEIVIQPVSTCYVPDVLAVYTEVARVLIEGGMYICAHKQPTCLQTIFQTSEDVHQYVIAEPYYGRGPLPSAPEESGHREAGTLEFLHRWESLVGGLCRSGFVLEDLIEPRHGDVQQHPGSFAHRSYFAPPFVTLKARRTQQTVSLEARSKLWIP
jgi:SAM-dependent methyltransferase